MMYDNPQLSPVESLAERSRGVEARRADVVDIAAYRVAAVRPVQGEAEDMDQHSDQRQVRAYTPASEAMKAAAITAGPVTTAERPMLEENLLLEEARKAASQAYDSAA